MDANLFSERLRRARMAAGLQGKELAGRLGISRPYLSQIEKGLRQPSPELLTRLASELGISFDSPVPPNPGNRKTERGGAAAYPETASGSGAGTVREPQECRIPEGCDIAAGVDSLRADMAAMRAQLDTLTTLLGASLHIPAGGERDACGKRRAG